MRRGPVGGLSKNLSVFPSSKEGQASSHVVVAVAGLQQAYKRLPMSSWCELVRRAWEEDTLVYLLGAPGERDFSIHLQRECGVEVRNLVGVAQFPRTVDIVRTAKMLFSVDSGLVHVADFFGVPSQVVFKGGNPKKWRPTTEGSVILDKALNPIQLSS